MNMEMCDGYVRCICMHQDYFLTRFPTCVLMSIAFPLAHLSWL